MDHLRRGTLDAAGIRVLVLDEADEMFSMGFAKELNAIMDARPESLRSETASDAFSRDLLTATVANTFSAWSGVTVTATCTS